MEPNSQYCGHSISFSEESSVSHTSHSFYKRSEFVLDMLGADIELDGMIQICRSESNLDSQIEMLRKINQNLPETIQIKMPSLLTNDYVVRALDVIEDRIRYAGAIISLSQS